jgi:hypothetical protein
MLSPSLHANAGEALRHSPIPALRKLAVEENTTTVVILGRVSSYYHKQLAQETIMPHLRDRELLNNVLVVRPEVAISSSS